MMYQETIEALRHDLNEDKKKYEGFERYKCFDYSIEMLPVLVERERNGRLRQVTNWDMKLLFEIENKEFYE